MVFFWYYIGWEAIMTEYVPGMDGGGTGCSAAVATVELARRTFPALKDAS